MEVRFKFDLGDRVRRTKRREVGVITIRMEFGLEDARFRRYQVRWSGGWCQDHDERELVRVKSRKPAWLRVGAHFIYRVIRVDAKARRFWADRKMVDDITSEKMMFGYETEDLRHLHPIKASKNKGN